MNYRYKLWLNLYHIMMTSGVAEPIAAQAAFDLIHEGKGK